jgi:hypothetical protein
MNKREVQKLKSGDCVFVCSRRRPMADGQRPGDIAFVVHVTPKGGVLLESDGFRFWRPYSVVYPEILHHRQEHRRPDWARRA